MQSFNAISRSGLRLAALAGASAVLVGTLATPAYAAKECRSFNVTIGSRTFRTGPSGDLRLTLPHQAVQDKVAKVRGKFIEFDIDLNTFAVSNYVLTGAPAPNQITPVRTQVFVSKVPDAILSGSMDMRNRTSGQNLELERDGSIDMKIQAKDCDQGGVFQMEPEPTTTETNTLAPAFRYCFQSAPSERRFFTNGVVLGYDSPEIATLLSGDDHTAVWSVQDGGRIGFVMGEDAVEALAEAGPDAIAACPHQTPDALAALAQ